MSSAWMKVTIAKLMIAECEYQERALEMTEAKGDKRASEILSARRAYWEEVLEQASLEYSLEGGS